MVDDIIEFNYKNMIYKLLVLTFVNTKKNKKPLKFL